MITKIKKGEFVALEMTRTTYFINPYRSESRQEWQIVCVTRATRSGQAMAVRWADRNSDDTLVHLAPYKPNVHRMERHQAGAAAVFASGKTTFATADEVRSAVLAAEGMAFDLNK